LGRLGIPFLRAKVGDRHVLEMLRETGGVIGGETSGHILCLDRSTTGDGIVSALQVLAVMRETGASLAELATGMTKIPQVLINVAVAKRVDPLILAVRRLGSRRRRGGTRRYRAGRAALFGTEPLIRVMVEGEDRHVVKTIAERLAGIVEAAAV
jgi:phosphoglucosamine mutase